MLKHTLNRFFREFRRQPLFSGIKLLGLTVGLATALLLLLYVNYEHQYDASIPESQHTYRVYRQWVGQEGGLLQVPMAAATAIRGQVPGVVASSYLWDWGEQLFKNEDQRFYLPKVASTDSLWLETVQLPLLYGDAATALDLPASIILSATAANKFFGASNPLGESLLMDGTDPYTVMGVFADDYATHLPYDAYINTAVYMDQWLNNSANNYLRLSPGTSVSQVEATIKEVAETPMMAGYQQLAMDLTKEELPNWRLQALPEVHLGSANMSSLSMAKGNLGQVKVFGWVALLVLILAAINYTNLSTALATKRAKEIGIRKVSGASGGLLLRQLLTESVVQTAGAGILALGVAQLALPYFNQLVDRQIELEAVFAGPSLLLWAGVILLLGLVAGAYPAFYLAQLQPTNSIQQQSGSRQALGFRKALVTLQFAATTVLLIVVAMVYLQVQFVQNQDLGFADDQVLVTHLHAENSFDRLAARTNELNSLPGVKASSWTSALPGNVNWTNNFAFTDRNEDVWAYYLNAGNELDEALGLNMKAGRFFDPALPGDSLNFVVNEAFIELYQIEDPIGYPMRMVSDTAFRQIIGVVSDFHFAGLEERVQPLAMIHYPNWVGSDIAIKLSTGNLEQSIAAVENFWGQVEPEHPFQYSFLDEDFARQYGEHQRFGQTMLTATLLMIFLAALGLFGLATYSAEQRSKELGVRKILGASIQQLISLLTFDYVKMILLALLPAIPLAWYLSNNWLANFAFRIDVQWWLFPLAALLLLGVAAISVGGQAWRAALINPAESLRDE